MMIQITQTIISALLNKFLSIPDFPIFAYWPIDIYESHGYGTHPFTECRGRRGAKRFTKSHRSKCRVKAFPGMQPWGGSMWDVYRMCFVFMYNAGMYMYMYVYIYISYIYVCLHVYIHLNTIKYIYIIQYKCISSNYD